MAAENVSLLHIEKERLSALSSYQIMDTAPEKTFDSIVQLAAQIFKVPIAFISFIDEDRVWFKASHGLAVPEMPREMGLCGYTIEQNTPLVINDALQHDLAKNNALVTGPMALRFYAAAPLVVKNGHRIGTLCIADTERREIDDKDVTSLTQLAEMTAAQLELRRQSQQQIFQQQDLLAHLSHELKNSISLVIGYASLLKDGPAGDESHPQFCDTIFNAGKRMASLVEEALVLASNRSPVLEIKKVFMALTPVVQEAASRFELQAKEKQQQLLIDIDADVNIEADPLKITEIIENLLSNAVKYSPFNKEIRLQVKKVSENRVRIIVTDEGPGLREFDFLKIFQPFTRLSAVPTGGESSTGIGLYIAHKLVMLHDGKIWASNRETGGAAFCVELPCHPPF